MLAIFSKSSQYLHFCMQKLTGGTLLCRNKDYIVFYRGNDFLPPVVRDAVKERSKLTDIRQDEEEQARHVASALIELKAKGFVGSLVAGTLAETLAATSRWGRQPSYEDVEKMMRDSTLSRHASLLRYLEQNLALVSGIYTKVTFYQKDYKIHNNTQRHCRLMACF